MSKQVADSQLHEIKRYESDFVNFISNRLGILIHKHQSNELYKTITSACEKFNIDVQSYLELLKNSEDQSPILDHLISGITVGETYFFRDTRQMQLLQNNIIPNLILLKRELNDLSLRIWSAGCASGEEIYTIAIMLKEQLPDINNWNLTLLGTDLNASALKKAIAASYMDWSMRSIDTDLKEKYFSLENNHYILRQDVREIVKFDYLNLNDDSYPSMFNGTNTQDLILCRNVLIYFDREHTIKVMHKLSNCLLPGAYLMLGASDPVEIKNTELYFHHDNGILFSRPIVKQVKLLEKNLDINLAPKLQITKTPKQKSQLHISKFDENTLMQLLNQEQWQEALAYIERYENEQCGSTLLLTAKATALANLGDLKDAEHLFKKSLTLDSTNKYSYFTYALVLLELNQITDAEKALRKTLFIDHKFVSAHYQLGLLLIRTKKWTQGLKCLTNALLIAQKSEPLQNVPGSKGISYGRLSEILTYEIELYTSLGKTEYEHENISK